MLVEECIVVDKEIILKQLDLNDIDELFKLTEKNEIRSIICTMNLKNKFSDIKILYDCDSEETNKIFSLLSEKEGVLLINNLNFEE